MRQQRDKQLSRQMRCTAVDWPWQAWRGLSFQLRISLLSHLFALCQHPGLARRVVLAKHTVIE